MERIERTRVERCTFQGGNGLVVGGIQTTNVDNSVVNCHFDGALLTYPNSIGAALNMQGAMYGCWARR